MKMLGVLLFICSITLQSQARTTQQLDPRIINGENVKLGEIPYQVSLQLIPQNHSFCGGSIVNEKWVITAGHCLYKKHEFQLQIVAGTLDLDKPFLTRKISKIIIHERYNPSSTQNHDIGLVKVEIPFVMSDRVNRVTIPKNLNVAHSNDKAVVSGWGYRYPGYGPSRILKKATIYIANDKFCRTIYSNSKWPVFDTNICAYDQREIKGPCLGDSGGPLTVNKTLVGIVSWATFPCAYSNYPAVFIRVSSYIDWIRNNTNL